MQVLTEDPSRHEQPQRAMHKCTRQYPVLVLLATVCSTDPSMCHSLWQEGIMGLHALWAPACNDMLLCLFLIKLI